MAGVKFLRCHVLRTRPQLRVIARYACIIIVAQAQDALRLRAQLAVALRSAEMLAILLDGARALLELCLVFHRANRRVS